MEKSYKSAFEFIEVRIKARTIEELSSKLERTEQENQLLQALLMKERQLHKIKIA